jgi:hypothetical protein
MYRFLSLAAMAVLLAGTAVQGQIIQYTLELGGDNQAELWKSGGSPPGVVPPFIPGSDADGQWFCKGDPLTWDVVVEVLDDSSNGLAAAKFFLELYQEDCVTPVAVSYYSTINDGTPGLLPDPDPLERAAFCHVFDIDGDGLNPPYTPSPIPGGTYNPLPHHIGYGPGRVFDTVAQGGPNMGYARFPDTDDHVGGVWLNGVYTPGSGSSSAATNALSGMACSYTQFHAGTNIAGIGMNVDYGLPPYGCVRGLGVLPLFEGQIDTRTLPYAGTYCLKLVPGIEHAILRGDFDCSSGDWTFEEVAVPVSLPGVEVIGDMITFDLLGGCGVRITKWSSVRDHDPDPYQLDLRELVLDPAASGSDVVSETRRNGPASPGDGLSGIKRICVEFEYGWMSWYYQPGVVAEDLTHPGQFYPATDEYWIEDGQVLVIEFMDSPDIETANSTLPDQACYRIDLGGHFPYHPLRGDTDCVIRALTGDVAGNPSGLGNGTTNMTDAAAIRNAFLNLVPPTGDNVRFDINCNGSTNQTDASFVRDIAFNGGIGVVCPE